MLDVEVSIVTPTFNEEKNIEELFERITKVLMDIKHDWELIIIDNASTDGTIHKIKSICGRHTNVKAIINNRNFGHVTKIMELCRPWRCCGLSSTGFAGSS